MNVCAANLIGFILIEKNCGIHEVTLQMLKLAAVLSAFCSLIYTKFSISKCFEKY